jgi:hypothetical protein
VSATNRGAVRNADDFYATPPWATRSILKALCRDRALYSPMAILEPSAGNGAIVDEIRAFGFPNEGIEAIEIDPNRADASGAQCADFLTIAPDPRFDLVITNPPFSLALEFAKHALQFLRPGGTLALLLRLNWLASGKRSEWLRDNTPSLYVLPKRPSFSADGKTDATDYAWFVWRPSVCDCCLCAPALGRYAAPARVHILPRPVIERARRVTAAVEVPS